MKKLLSFTTLTLFAALAFPAATLHAQVYPSPDWPKADPAKHGFDVKKLEAARNHIKKTMHTTGLIVVVGGESIFEHGNLTRVSYLASCRKSVLAMLYGKWVENGAIDLSRTLGELGIDDIGGLLPIEKQATIGHLITARSGVYHDASNPGDDAENRPARGSKKPGSYFLYNNWDFNAAGAVFEQLTKQNIYKAFREQIALPVEMQDFDLKNQKKGGNLKKSRFPAYHFYLSTRDMARIGLLMLRDGRWKDKQVISPEWKAKIISVVTPKAAMYPSPGSEARAKNNIFEYGCMWWLFKVDDPAYAGAYTARGAVGQFITVLPALDMVVAHKTDPADGKSVAWGQYYTLLKMLTAAKIK